ncbi:TonB-dependent receptor [Thermodesulfovibrionales bacterium]|nr:TonB-dependent receptor [Thermodesulfovibrionales bacterium]
MRKLKLVWLVLAGLIVGAGSFSGLSFAEEAYAEEVLVIEEVVVTATRVERPLAHIPASVTVITREEIEKTYAKTVDDFLRREVGVQVRRTRGLTVTGAHTAVYMRGTGDPARVLILKDGVPLNTKYTGRVALLNAMSIQDIERIEIVRGAASALYGSSAMGGVINIITRRAEPGFAGNVSLEAGNLDTQIGSLGLRYGAENFALRFAAERKQTGGYEYRDPWDPKDQGWRLPEMELNHISVGGDLWLGESLLRVDFDHFTEDALVGTRVQWDVAPETNKYRVGWEMPLFGFGEETVFSIKGYYFDDEYIGTSHRLNPATREFDIFKTRITRSSDDYGIMAQVSTVLGNHHLVAGVDFSGASVDHHQEFAAGGDRKFEGEQSLYAVFVNNEMHLGERMILSAGLRYDRWENVDGRFYDHALGVWEEYPAVTDSAISPRGGIVYKLTEDTRLRASLGTGFRAPSLRHMYRAGPHGRFYDLGNPELRPEKLDWSYDVGVDMQPHENLNLSLTFYQSRLSDFLGRETLLPGDPGIPHWLDPGGLPVRRMINVGEVDIHGIEAGLEFRFDEKWSAFINHTYNVSKVREHEKDPEVEGNYLAWSPRHISVVGFTYDNPRLFTLSLSIENKGSRFTGLDNEREVAGFHMVNMRVSRELFGGMEVFANVENLTDEEWMDSAVTIGPPFNLLVGARHTF